MDEFNLTFTICIEIQHCFKEEKEIAYRIYQQFYEVPESPLNFFLTKIIVLKFREITTLTVSTFRIYESN